MEVSLPGSKVHVVGSPSGWKVVEGAAGQALIYLALVNASGHVLKQFKITEDLGDDLANLGVDDIVSFTFDVCKSKLGLKRWGE